MAKPKTPEKPSSDQKQFDLKPTEKPTFPKTPEDKKTPIVWRVWPYPGGSRRWDSNNDEFLDKKEEDKK